MPIIARIGVTGGPAGGKTYFTSYSKEYFTKCGLKPVYLSEVATLFNSFGIGPMSKVLDNVDYQFMIAKYQLESEEVLITSLAKSSDEILLICDRTILDGKAYCSEKEWEILLERLKMTEADIYDRYDLILHFVTTATGKYSNYSTENNPARHENASEALEREKLNVAAYNGMPISKRIHLNNDVKMEEKQLRAVNAILAYLNMAEPVFGKQTKYLVKKVNHDKINKFLPKKISIIQDYLNKRKDEEERRVRCIIDDGYKSYYYTEKILGELIFETQISKEEYYSYLKDKNETENKTIRKERWYFEAYGLYFQYDEFEFWDEFAILEVQPTNLCENIVIPDEFVLVQKDANLSWILKNEFLSRKAISQEDFKIMIGL